MLFRSSLINGRRSATRRLRENRGSPKCLYLSPFSRCVHRLARARGRRLRKTGQPYLTGSTPLQHSGNAKVFVELRPMNAQRHQFEVLACRGGRIFQSRIPGQGGRDPAAVSERHHQFVGGKATEIGLISPTSISKVLMPFAFEKVALRPQMSDNSANFVRRKSRVDGDREIMQPEFGLEIS